MAAQLNHGRRRRVYGFNVEEHRTEGNDAGQHAIFLKAGQIDWSRPTGAVGHKQTLLVQLELGGTTHDNKEAVITSLFQRLGAQSRYGTVV